MGWLVTSALGPNPNLDDFDAHSHVTTSTGRPGDISRFGVLEEPGTRPGILDDFEANDGKPLKHHQGEPSVSGALADLHNAVTSKIKSWNPYFAKSSYHPYSSTNRTTSKASGKTPPLRLDGESVKEGMKDEDRLGARVRIGKGTVLFNGNDFWERCIRTHEQHDRNHGYRLHVLRQELMDDVWSKPAYVLSLLLRELAKPKSERLDWLFWVDSDTIIMNPYIPIETFLPPPGTEFDDVYMMFSMDWNGLNNGVFPIRVNQWAVNLFSAIVAYRQFNPDVPLQFRDQSAMNNLIQERQFAKHILQAPQRWFNAYQGEHNETLQPFQVRRGDLLVHFAGVFPREERMQFWLERAEQHLEEWEVPVKSTSYPEEAKEFWRQQKGIRHERARKLQLVLDEAIHLMASTDQRLLDYGDRLAEEQKANIGQQRETLKRILEQENTKDDQVKIEEGIRVLTESTQPLTAVITEANRVILQSAHKAIFAAEKDLIEGGFGEGRNSPELDEIAERVQNLKAIIMTPEATWNRQELIATMNALTEASARRQENLGGAITAQQNEVVAQTSTADAEVAVSSMEPTTPTEPTTLTEPETAPTPA